MKHAGMVALLAITLSFSIVFSADETALSRLEVVDTLHAVGGLYESLGEPRMAIVPGSGKGTDELMVPLVDTDTGSYHKKLWFGESVLMVPPDMESQSQVVAAIGPVVMVAFPYAVYSSTEKRDWEGRLAIGVSTDFGLTWSSLQTIHTSQSGFHPRLCRLGSHILLAYDNYSDSGTDEIWFRSFDTASLTWSDSVLVISTPETDLTVIKPYVSVTSDTVCIAYHAVDQKARWFEFRVSTDSGYSWSPVDAQIEAGNDHNLLPIDTGFALVFGHDLQVYVARSFDMLRTWTENSCISSINSASQRPAAASDGKTDVHACWYDFEGIESGCGGFPYYTRSQDQGATWDTIKSFSDCSCAERLDIFAEEDYVYAVWNWSSHEDSPHYSLNMRCSRDRGSTWTETIVFEDTYKAWECDVYAHGDYIYMAWWEQHPPDWIRNVYFRLGAWYTPGDIDMSGSIDIADLIYMVMYMFQEGPQPWVMGAVEMNGVEGIDISDLVYLAMYMFQEGPPPVGAPEPWE